MFNKITDFDNIRLAYLKARKGKTTKPSVIEFKKNICQNLQAIKTRLETNPHFGTYTQFTIHDPKFRVITATTFEERIMQHAVINILEPVFERHFIYHTYACRKNKGSHKALRTLKNKCRNSDYFIKLDVRKFFDSINHDVLKQKLQKLLNDRKTFLLNCQIIDSYKMVSKVSNSEPKGLPIGNLTSQFYANFYLSSLDHLIIEKLKPIFYCRYMDDMILLVKSRQQGNELFEKITAYCKTELKLNLKPLVLGRIKDGIPFLGYKVFKNKIVPLAKKKNAHPAFS